MKVISLFAAAAIIFPLGLSAGDMREQSTFSQLDKDGDGYVSINEATGQMELLKEWANVDKDTDGMLEQAEFSAFEEAPSATFTPLVNPDEPEPGAGPTD